MIGKYIIHIYIKNKIQSTLELNNMEKIKEMKYYEYSASFDFICPKIIYIKFKSNQNTLKEIITRYSLISFQGNFSQNDPLFFWQMHSTSNVFKDVEYKLKWWNPSLIKENIYSNYYDGNDDNPSRIILQYLNGDFYIIIECPGYAPSSP